MSGAFEGNALVGGSFGFVSASSVVPSLHSHVTAVAPDRQGGGVGLALKHHQRAWALGRGIEEITWTFDPLVRRNGWFNLMKLGAEVDAYHADFYGHLPDLVNGDDDTDRCVARWRLDLHPDRPRVAALPEGVALVVEDDAGGPRVVVPVGGLADVTGERVLCQVPVDILTLRRNDASAARRWRVAVRETMGRAIDQGYVATAMTARRPLPAHPEASMKIEAVELRRIRLPLVAPFQTSFGTETGRDILLVRVLGPEAEGWGECVALGEPTYSSEYVDGAHVVIRDHLLPRLAAAAGCRPPRVGPWLAPVKGHPMAKAALEMAVLDAELRRATSRLRRYLGAVRDAVPAGVSVGIMPARSRSCSTRSPATWRTGLPADQAQDRAGLGRRAGPGGAGALRRRRPAPGRRQRRLHPGRRAGTSPGSTRSTCS